MLVISEGEFLGTNGYYRCWDVMDHGHKTNEIRECLAAGPIARIICRLSVCLSIMDVAQN